MLLELNDINVYYDKKTPVFGAPKKMHALKDVNLSVEKGEIVTIVGESGCGKTTLGKVITGLLKLKTAAKAFRGISSKLGISLIFRSRQRYLPAGKKRMRTFSCLREASSNTEAKYTFFTRRTIRSCASSDVPNRASCLP